MLPDKSPATTTIGLTCATLFPSCSRRVKTSSLSHCRPVAGASWASIPTSRGRSVVGWMMPSSSGSGRSWPALPPPPPCFSSIIRQSPSMSVGWMSSVWMMPASTIGASPEIKIVCAGHVHREFAGHIGTAEMYTTPSTCVQFGERARGTFDTGTPAYRTFTLGQHHHRTTVHRLGPSVAPLQAH